MNNEEIQQWKRRIRSLLRTFPKDYVINVDETCWYFYPKGLLTWARKDPENVSYQIDGNDKDHPYVTLQHQEQSSQ